MTNNAILGNKSKHAATPLDESLRITNPALIPSRRYYDQEFFEAENKLLWPRVWQMACRLEEIPEVGDWVEYQILDKSVIVIRTKAGIKAFHNVCRHRGVKLAEGHGNCKIKGFTCPFHGWRWDTEGKNTYIYGRELFDEDIIASSEVDLKPCRVEFWGGCAFINFDDNAPPLMDCIQPMADRVDPRNVDQLKVEWWCSTVLPTNWKLAMEAFMEGYHVMRTHPQLWEVYLPGMDKFVTPPKNPGWLKMAPKEIVERLIESMQRLGDGMAGMVHATDIAVANDIKDKVKLPDEPTAALREWARVLNDEITTRARARGVPMPDLNDLAANHPCQPVQFIFPHYFLLPMYGNMSSYRIRPLTAETCLFEIWSLVLYPEGEQRERPTAPVPLPYDSRDFPEIPQQDYSNLPLQQVGLHGGEFDFLRLARAVEGLVSNYQRTIDGFVFGQDQDKLVKAMQVASGELDSPILDIGF